MPGQAPMVLQWIDPVASFAYVCVRGPLSTFREFLQAIDRLTADPRWIPGMPIVQDLREATDMPRDCVEEWRTFMATRTPRLAGCRWAVVRPERPVLALVLDLAAADAALSAVTLKQFSDMVDAHEWAQPITEHA